jgi:hypothetical protein
MSLVAMIAAEVRQSSSPVMSLRRSGRASQRIYWSGDLSTAEFVNWFSPVELEH